MPFVIPDCSSCFNTSHVTLYPQGAQLVSEFANSFNTSHVTLYPGRNRQNVSFSWFQYITCYSLSLLHWKLKFRIYSFNTSHVTLYQHGSSFHLTLHSFQYITCYSLSGKDTRNGKKECVSIHHMLLFIREEAEKEVKKYRFNTSHVTLYQGSVAYELSKLSVFQYITCYSLSLYRNILYSRI